MHAPPTPSPIRSNRLGMRIGYLLFVLNLPSDVHFFLDVSHVDPSDFGLLAIENLGDFLQSGALGLHVEEVDEGEFEGDPNLQAVNVSS